jgi:integrase/recombinase XerD
MKLRDVIAEYVAHQQSLGHNPNPRKSLLLTFNRNAGNEIEVQNVNTDRVLTFLGRPTTDYWRQKYSALACFYRYAISRGYATSSPLPRRISRAFPQFVPYIYSHDDVRRLLEATQSYRRRHTLLEPHTFRAIMILLYGAGLRISEALSLRVSDVDLSHSLLLIRKTKFHKSRFVPIGRQVQREMEQFFRTRREANHSETPDTPFFIGRKGNRLTVNAVRQSFRHLCEFAGIRRVDGARYQPRLHDLRHTFCVNRVVAAYEAGADVTVLLPRLSTYLGHINIASTQRYLTMTSILLQRASERFERYAIERATHD